MSEGGIQKLSSREKFTLTILCCMNLLNYVDRYCGVYVEYEIKKSFALSDNLNNLYGYANIIAYSVSAPLFGYLGDRYSRCILLIFSIGCWTISHFISSFQNNYPIFVLFRAFVGIGQSGFVNIAPSVLASIVFHEKRTIILAIFYGSVPLGSGFGFIIGSKMTKWFGWWWTFRSTTIVGLAGTLLLYFGEYPERGQKEAAIVGKKPAKATPYLEDLNHFRRNISFILITIGYTCTCFVIGSIVWYGTEFLQYGFEVISVFTKETVNYHHTVFAAGITFTLSGVLGVLIGSALSYYQRRMYPSADTVICGTGLAVAWPFLTIALYTAGTNKTAAFFFLFVGQTTLNFIWAVLVDMLLYVVVPTRHSSCLAFTVVFSYLFAELLSHSAVRLLMEYFLNLANKPFNWIIHTHKLDEVYVEGVNKVDDDRVKFLALQMSLFMVLILQLVGSVVFFVNKRFIVKYRKLADEEMIAS